jgi:hypothetical protein
VLTTHPGDVDGGSRLYRGVVSHFEPSESGGLRLLTLTLAKRGKGRGNEFEWRDVPGTEILVLGESIHSINLKYLEQFDEPAPETPWQGFWRRFWREEP